MNVIWHAFPDNEVHPITMSVQVEPEDIVMHFEDDGMAFDPLLAPAPKLPTSIEKAVPGGLGLMLVRKYARSVAYERRAGRNCIGTDLKPGTNWRSVDRQGGRVQAGRWRRHDQDQASGADFLFATDAQQPVKRCKSTAFLAMPCR